MSTPQEAFIAALKMGDEGWGDSALAPLGLCSDASCDLDANLDFLDCDLDSDLNFLDFLDFCGSALLANVGKHDCLRAGPQLDRPHTTTSDQE